MHASSHPLPHRHTHSHGEPRPAAGADTGSALLLSAPARLAVAGGLAALLWALVAWAMA